MAALVWRIAYGAVRMGVMKITRLILFATVLAAPTQLIAGPAAVDHVPSDVSVLAYGAAHPECLEWTDHCRICMRSPDGRVDCSTPGIACVQKEIECKKSGTGKE